MVSISNMDADVTLSSDDKEFVCKIARSIQKSGFVTPAVFFLEMVRPLSSIGGHIMVFMGPVLNLVLNSDNYYRAAELLNNKKTLLILLDEIERLEMLDSDSGLED